jgi:hypothetical protein
VAAIAKERPIPLRFIGVGEGLDDLKPFVAASSSTLWSTSCSRALVGAYSRAEAFCKAP